MKKYFFAFYGADSIGIFIDAHRLLQYKNSIRGFKFETFTELELAKKFIIEGYNRSRFIYGRIRCLDDLLLNKIYNSAEIRRMGWTSTDLQKF